MSDSHDAARCTIREMESATKGGIFPGKMSFNQTYYVQGNIMATKR